MRVELGSRVKSRDGVDVGVVKHLIIDPEDNRVRAVVLEQGFILTHDSVVPIEDLSAEDETGIQINRLADEIKGLPTFHSADYRDIDPSDRERFALPVGALWPYSAAPPGSSQVGAPFVAFPFFPAPGDAAQPLPMAAVERSKPAEPSESEFDAGVRLAAITRGTEVVTMDGNRVGEVKDVVFDGMSGRPISLMLSRGFLFTEDISLPGRLIASVESSKVTLTVDKSELEKWATAPSVPFV